MRLVSFLLRPDWSALQPLQSGGSSNTSLGGLVAQPVERLVNLALFLADAPGTVTAVAIRENVAGYSADSDEAAFKRMLERDKDVLRSAGLVISSDDEGNYALDRAATYVAPLELAPPEAAAIRAAGIALQNDPAFPFPEDLRLALAKISAEIEGPEIASVTSLADEDPRRQGELVAELSSAASRRKRSAFDYTNSLGARAQHEVEPYGLFLHDGRWYLVALDVARAETRTYAVSRMQSLVVNPSAPKTPDFERPPDFDVARFLRLPFQYGPDRAEFSAVLRFGSESKWRAAALSADQGTLEEDGDALVWTVTARSVDGLLRFAIENGPGIDVVGPAAALAALADGLGEVERVHD